MTDLDKLRRYTVARNFGTPTTLKRALHKMGFVQADPIRAPARAQDLILLQRVNNYRAGDLELRYETLDIEEDVFVNYGFVTRSVHALMHPRSNSRASRYELGSNWPLAQRRRAQLILEFVRERDTVHPRQVDEHFSHGKVRNYWGGSSNLTTHLLDALHYRGLLRVARREKGIRIYQANCRAPQENHPQREALLPGELPIPRAERQARIDALVDVVVRIYAPLPGPSLAAYIRCLRYAVPHWRQAISGCLQRAKSRLSHARVDGVDWYWPTNEEMISIEPDERVRLLTPFDPLVHDRARFELLWNWEYRFEAYTPARKRKLGYYAMPMLWRDRVIGWANLSIENGELTSEIGYVATAPRDGAFRNEFAAEMDRIRAFLMTGYPVKSD